MTHAYAIISSKVNNPEPFKAYMAATPPTVAAFGGEYMVRGGAQEVLEGDWSPARIVVLRFPSMAQAKAWYFGEGYTQARVLRQGATDYFNVTLVEGYTP